MLMKKKKFKVIRGIRGKGSDAKRTTNIAKSQRRTGRRSALIALSSPQFYSSLSLTHHHHHYYCYNQHLCVYISLSPVYSWLYITRAFLVRSLTTANRRLLAVCRVQTLASAEVCIIHIIPSNELAPLMANTHTRAIYIINVL